MASHFLIMCLFSILVGAFFATLTRDTMREAIKAAALLALTMVGISLIIAYIMYFLPLGG
ncbi:MAG TPA: hypothetical protein VFE84_12080 [Patescibacteria group bacterium]|nr:hypothetical protein [Patescibacteria group bacterium]